VSDIKDKYGLINRIRFSLDRHSSSYYEVEIDILTRLVTWREGLYGKPEYLEQASINSINEFVEGMSKCDILKWYQEYQNYDVLDGIRWSLDIQLDSILIHKFGSNAYPIQWEMFCEIIRKLVDKPIN
jgi:hypothetical protein